MSTFDFLQAKCVGGDITSPSATTASSTEYLTGPITYNTATGAYGSAVDEIDLGAGSGYAGTAGAGLGRQLWLQVKVTAVTGSNGFTVTVETDDNTSHTSATSRFVTPTITATGDYNWPLPYLPERYAYLKTISGATSTGTLVAALSDNGDSRLIT